MKQNLQDSIVLITSSKPDNSRFGTGFVVHQDELGTYIVTCAHVINDVGGYENVKVDNDAAKIQSLGCEESIDMAVLRVEKQLNKPSLRPSYSAESHSSFITVGFQLYGKRKLSRKLQGELGELVRLTHSGKERIKAWDLKITGDNGLQPGYSGSPVIDEANGCVLGVVSDSQGGGEKGLAIAIENLNQICLYDFLSDLGQETGNAQKIKYSDSQNLPKLGPLVSKMCNRWPHVCDFLELFQKACQDCPDQPQFYFIHGNKGESHCSFTLRLIKNYIEKYSETKWGEQNAAVVTRNITWWPLEGSLEERKRNLIMNLFSALDESYMGTDDYSLSSLIKLRCLNNKDSVFVIKHNIHTSEWDDNSEELIRWYVEDYWNILECYGEMPQFLIFFNIEYVSVNQLTWTQRIFKRHDVLKKRITDFLEDISTSLQEQFPCKLIQELAPVKESDLIQWFADYFAHENEMKRQDRIKSIFREENQQKSMAEVEMWLEEIIEEYHKMEMSV